MATIEAFIVVEYEFIDRSASRTANGGTSGTSRKSA
jgi:hypothetical protein